MNAPRMAAIVLAVLLLAYPLSIGPVTRYYMGNTYATSTHPPASYYTFYQPLWWCCKSGPAQMLLAWYVEVWYPKWFADEVALKRRQEELSRQ